jgi:segregation and condensation protein B
MTANEIAHIVQLDLIGTQNLLLELQQDLDQRHSGLTIRQVAGGYQLATRPEAFAVVERLSQVVDRKISAPTMETLSIIAFRQPITKAEIEQIRGVRIERALQKLMELELVAEVGARKSWDGRSFMVQRMLFCAVWYQYAGRPAGSADDRRCGCGLDAEQMELFNEVQQLQAERTETQEETPIHEEDPE